MQRKIELFKLLVISMQRSAHTRTNTRDARAHATGGLTVVSQKCDGLVTEDNSP